MSDVLPPLFVASDLSDMGGSTVTEDRAAAAGGAIRRRAGWHIAPEVRQVLILDHDGGPVLRLPSLLVVEVHAVRDLTGSSPRELTGWRWSAAGMIEGRGLPRGFRSVEVDLTHGYAECPEDLLKEAADGLERRVVQESLGSRSVSYESGGRDSGTVERLYWLGPRP